MGKITLISLGVALAASGVVVPSHVVSNDRGVVDNQVEVVDTKNLVTPELTLIQNIDATYNEVNYGPKTKFNRHDYFANLKDYSPKNNIGSCGYVSLSQVLSYYDTFYNDGIVPEQYERHLETAKTEAEVNLQSPGLVNEYYTNVGYTTGNAGYYQYCNDTQEENLQSKLTVIHNELGGTNNASNFAYSIGCWDYQAMLNEFYGDTTTVQVRTASGLSQEQYIAKIKNRIDAGHPCIVHVKHSSGASGAHSVVCYDYDDTKIYTHYGWGGTSSTYDVYQSYDQIYYYAEFEFGYLPHKHSDNYVINGKGHCGCNLDDTLKCTIDSNGDHIIYWMKDPSSYVQGGKVTLGLKLASIIDRPIIDNNIINLRDGFKTLTTPEADISDDLIRDLDNDTQTFLREYGFEIDEDIVNIGRDPNITIRNRTTAVYVLSSDTNAIKIPTKVWDEYFGGRLSLVPATFVRYGYVKYVAKTQILRKTNFTATKTTVLTTSDYGFSQVYVTTPTTKVIEKEALTVTTNRLRCGNIKDTTNGGKEYTVISAKKSGAGTAYLEYSFSSPIKNFDIYLSMWSTSESLTSSSGTATLQYQDANGEWVTLVDLLASNMSKDKTNMSNYDCDLPAGVTEIRVYSTVKSATGSSNKGRICIGDLTVIY